MQQLDLNRTNSSDVGCAPSQTPSRLLKLCSSDEVIEYDVFGIPIPTRSNLVYTDSSNAFRAMTTVTGEGVSSGYGCRGYRYGGDGGNESGYGGDSSAQGGAAGGTGDGPPGSVRYF